MVNHEWLWERGLETGNKRHLMLRIQAMFCW